MVGFSALFDSSHDSQTGVVAGAPPTGTISADRLRLVLGRVATGFYDQPAARESVARGVAGDLENDHDAG